MTYPELPSSAASLEEEVLAAWEREDTFRRSLEAREDGPEFVFYEGPPTANGRPGIHHVLSRTIKDLVARYRTMTGHHVTRIAGWDTHGLPVEIEAERKLGISGKPEIEALGIEAFNRVCRENIFTYREEWERLSLRIGYWLDYERAYVTCTPEYIESAWWALKEIDRKGLLYRGYRVLPYCPRCGTGLSSHEVAQGYREVEDTAVTVAFPLVDDPDDTRVLSWTTTPWTLPGNMALAVHPGIEYVRVRVTKSGIGKGSREGDVLLLARERLDALFGDDEVEEVERLPGRALVGRRYRPPFPGAVDAGGSEKAWTLLPADFVTTEEGTGVVHTAVMYGADDFELGRESGLPMRHTVDEDGRFMEGLPDGLAGRRVNDPETERRILDALSGRGLLVRRERYRHSYPHCWRCDAALLYMARDSWYVRTTAVRDRMVAHNRAVAWHPPEIGAGRMGEWLENNVDWALSRDRYWGTPLPIWECERDREHREVVGSLEELAARAGGLPEGFDPHRPEIDRLTWPCGEEGCGGVRRRVPQVADAWFDSGSMPYAQWHHPFENREAFRRHFPADFIAEGVDQTRGWFYSLLALSTLLFDRSAYRSVVVNGLVLDAEGRKMSKSRGNTVDPWEALGRHGADAIRFFLIAGSHPWTAKRWDPEAISEVERRFFETLRNSYRFFALYARLEDWKPGDGGALPAPRAAGNRSVMDRWLLSRLASLASGLRDRLDDYDLTTAARELADFVVDELSNWYVRRSRDRFWATRAGPGIRQSSSDAFATLHEALTTVARCLAPFAPFLSDWIHRSLLDGASVHLADYPGPEAPRDPALEREMSDARELVALGRAARERVGLRVRQPLRRMRVLLPGGRRLSPEVLEQLRDELNVRTVEFVGREDDITRLSVKPDYAVLGPRFGGDTPSVAAAIAKLSGRTARRLREGEAVELELGEAGRTVTLEPGEVKVVEEAREGLSVEGRQGFLAALDTTLDPELRREGLARELVSRLQQLRRRAGLEISDRIEAVVGGAAEVERAVREHGDYIAREILAVVDGEARLHLDGEGHAMEHTDDVEIEGHPVHIGLRRVPETGRGRRRSGREDHAGTNRTR